MTPKNRRVSPSVPPPEPSADFPFKHAIPDDAAKVGPGRGMDIARTVLGTALVMGLSVVVAWAARRHVLASPRFAVEEVIITGNHARTPSSLATEAGVNKGMNIFAVDLDRARASLLNDPWIETATLSRRLPGRVFITVTEREIGAIVALPETYLAAKDGRIFKRLEVGDNTDLPIITGLTSEAIAQDREGLGRTIVRALDLAGDYEHGPLAVRAPLEEVHVSNGGELSLVVGKDGVTLSLGLPPFRHKLDEAARIFSELDKRGDRPSVLMLDDEARPDRVVVRTR